MGATRELYEQAVECFNRHDVDGLLAGASEESIFVRPGWGEGEYHGAASAADYFRALWEVFPDMTMHPTRYIEQGDDLAVEFSWTGTNAGPIHLSESQTIPATGRQVTGRGVDLVSVRAGRLRHSEVFNSGRSLDTLAQLGLIADEGLVGQR